MDKHYYFDNIINGTDYSLEELLNKYGNPLLYFINSIISNLSVSEDLMEDSFVQLIIKKKVFEDELKFRAYLFKAGRNKAYNFLKRSSIIKFQSFDETEEIIDGKSDVEEIYLKTEQMRLLNKSMECLNQEYRDVLYLIYFEDMSYDMVATVMKKSKKQIDNLTFRAKKQLRAIIEREDSYEKQSRTY